VAAADHHDDKVNKPIDRRKDMNMKTNRTLNLLAAALVGALAMSGLATHELSLRRPTSINSRKAP
jgi:hypothetical protein